MESTYINEENNLEKTEYKINICVITSVIKTSNVPWTYNAVRSKFTPEERYEQTLLTIKSLKEKIPNAYIVLLEGSDIEEEMKKVLESECDLYFDQSKNKEVRDIVDKSKIKGIGEVSQLLNFYESEEFKNIKPKMTFLFKISGRYYLNDKFNYNDFDNNCDCFRRLGNIKIVSTVFYKISDFDKHYKKLQPMIKTVTSGLNLEHNFGIQYKYEDAKSILVLGVTGNIAPNGRLWER